jgi:hypothetical protein
LNLFATKNGINERMDAMIEEFEITKLDIQRMQRYLDKCTYPSENLPDADDDEDADA